MIWESWVDFLAMGGYAPYVWGSYGVMLGLMAVESSLLVMRRRNILRYLGWKAGGREHAPARQEPGKGGGGSPS